MNDTVAAISTAYGKGGIAVIRISGDNAIQVADKVFLPKTGISLSDVASNMCVYGDIIKSGARIDDGMCTVFRAPHSYTGENVVEISCHGGILLTENVLEAVFEAGARQAEAGEFTKRAFINGKLSLSQAEAVGMLIDAVSDEALRVAASHENGAIKRVSDRLYKRLKTVVTGIYANVDFPDEDLTELSDSEVLSEISEIENELVALKGSYRVGRAVCEGIPTAIVGKPNTGKSSLLNRLVGYERAIVTDVAGTTRDTVEETVHCGRILLRVCDTAGIHETDDKVEKIGVEKSLAALNNAELVLSVFDRSSELDCEDMAFIELLKNSDALKIAVLNKSDLECGMSADALEKFDLFTDIVEISASCEDSFGGIEKLKDIICSHYISGDIDYNSSAVISNARQNASVSAALGYVTNAVCELKRGSTSDTVGFDLEAALSELSELDGRRVTEEIVDGIFHRFCVGK